MFFGGQPKGIKPHGMQHGLALHSGITAHDIGGGIAFWMTDVEPVTARVREHIQYIEFVSLGEIWCPERLPGFPVRLPFGFYFCRIVAHHRKSRVSRTIKIVSNFRSWTYRQRFAHQGTADSNGFTQG